MRRARWILPVASSLDPKHPSRRSSGRSGFGVTACPDAWASTTSRRTAPLVPATGLRDHRWTAPPVTDLYMVHAVYTPPDGRRWWLHTHGLERAGLPDWRCCASRSAT